MSVPATSRTRRLRLVAAVAAVAVLAVVAVGPAAAGSGLGALFNLGKSNVYSGTTTLSGTTTKPLLQVTNKGTGAGISITTKAATPPLKVSSSALVANLNADKLDGRHASDFVPAAGQTQVSQSGFGWRENGLSGVGTVSYQSSGALVTSSAAGLVTMILPVVIPTSVGGSAMRVDGVQICYSAFAGAGIPEIAMLEYDNSMGNTSLLVDDGTGHTGWGCPYYAVNPAYASNVLTSLTSVQMQVTAGFSAAAQSVILGIVTVVLEPTTTPATQLSAP